MADIDSLVAEIENESRKVGSLATKGKADTQQWINCVSAQIAKKSTICPGSDKIDKVDGCRKSSGYDGDVEGGTIEMFVPDTIKAPIAQSSKARYTEAYNKLKNKISGMQTMDDARDTCDKLVPKEGGKRRVKKRVKKTRGKKRVKKRLTKRKRGKKHVKKTRVKKGTKSKGARKRTYRRKK